MTGFLDAALRLGFGVLLACAGLSGAASAAPADAPQPLQVRGASEAAATLSAPAAHAFVRAGFVRFDARRQVPLACVPSAAAAPAAVSVPVPEAAPAFRSAASRRARTSRGPPASA